MQAFVTEGAKYRRRKDVSRVKRQRRAEQGLQFFVRWGALLVMNLLHALACSTTSGCSRLLLGCCVKGEAADSPKGMLDEALAELDQETLVVPMPVGD